jgi:arylsulfatase A-like enzyme
MIQRTLLAMCLSHVACLHAAAAEKPNVIVIVADDLGYADIGVQGCQDVPTPHIDSLAAAGVRCSSGYVSCPVCSPTRAGLMTGRYQQRFGHEYNPGRVREEGTTFGLPLTEVTMANRFQQAGYVTGMVGKWHLGFDAEFHPQQRGFAEYFGFLGGGHSYLDAKIDRANPILRGTEPVDETEYLTDALGREAVAFVERHCSEPFFLYLTFNAVHTPMHGCERLRERFAGIQDPKRQTFATMLASLDEAVGGVLEALGKHGIDDNTLIVFISDNGGPTRANTSRNDPLSGFKGQVREGGIRVPFLVQWKAHLPAGKVYDAPVIALDILPTALAASGTQVPDDARFDGVNLLPFLSGDKIGSPHEWLCWRFGAQRAVRAGNWKLVQLAEGEWELFNLETDIAETENVAGKHPDKVSELTTTFDRWNAQLEEPRWKGRRRPAAGVDASGRRGG